MKIGRTLLASVLALTSLRARATETEKTQPEVPSAKFVLRQQYAELEDLKTQLELARGSAETNTIAFVISGSLVGAGLILDILGVKASQVTRITNIGVADAVIFVGTVGFVSTGVILKLDANKIASIEERIRVQQIRIADTAKELL